MAHRAVDDAALPVWYQEQCDRVHNLKATMASLPAGDVRDALASVVALHQARAQVLEDLMKAELAR